MKNYYVFVLINPEQNNLPFFVDILEAEESATSGISPTLQEIRTLWNDQKKNLNENQIKVGESCLAAGLDQSETIEKIFRVVARGLDRHQAELIMKGVIYSCYPEKTFGDLSSQNCSCYRSYDQIKNQHEFINGFDPRINDGTLIRDDGLHACGKHYVYALFNPISKKIFYVGKGSGNRISNHFSDAIRLSPEKRAKKKNEKLETIRSLIDCNYSQEMMTKILARVETDEDSMLLETFFMKFGIGASELENATAGKFHEKIRAKDDWELRWGFEKKVETKGTGGRLIEEDLFKGECLQFLDGVTQAIVCKIYKEKKVKLVFQPARISGAGELSRDAELCTAFGPLILRIHIRSRHTEKIQTLLLPGSISRSKRRDKDGTAKVRAMNLFGSIVPRAEDPQTTGKDWLRGDGWFNCKSWQGQKASFASMEAVNRAVLLCKLGLFTDELTAEELEDLFPLS